MSASQVTELANEQVMFAEAAAAAQLGTCTYQGSGGDPVIQPNTTKTECDKLGGSWVPNSPPPPGP